MKTYETIKMLCSERGISISSLEKELEIGNGTIGKWASRSSQPQLVTLLKIARFFDVKLEYLLGEG